MVITRTLTPPSVIERERSAAYQALSRSGRRTLETVEHEIGRIGGERVALTHEMLEAAGVKSKIAVHLRELEALHFITREVGPNHCNLVALAQGWRGVTDLRAARITAAVARQTKPPGAQDGEDLEAEAATGTAGTEDIATRRCRSAGTVYAAASVANSGLAGSMTAPLRHTATSAEYRGFIDPGSMTIRDRLLCEAAAAHFSGASDREASRGLHTALLRYRSSAWRRERTEFECPERHAGRINAHCFAILSARDHLPSAETIRQIISRSSCF